MKEYKKKVQLSSGILYLRAEELTMIWMDAQDADFQEWQRVNKSKPCCFDIRTRCKKDIDLLLQLWCGKDRTRWVYV